MNQGPTTMTGLRCAICSETRRVGWVTCGRSRCQEASYLANKARSRPVLALGLLAIAIFIAFGSDSGVLGRCFVGFVDHYLGQLGTMLVVFFLIVAAYLVGVPARAATEVVKVARSFCARFAPPIEVKVAPAPSAVDRRKADDVRCAMKSLGYPKHEYDLVVSGLDLHLPLEQLMRSSIQKLHKQKVLS